MLQKFYSKTMQKKKDCFDSFLDRYPQNAGRQKCQTAIYFPIVISISLQIFLQNAQSVFELELIVMRSGVAKSLKSDSVVYTEPKMQLQRSK